MSWGVIDPVVRRGVGVVDATALLPARGVVAEAKEWIAIPSLTAEGGRFGRELESGG